MHLFSKTTTKIEGMSSKKKINITIRLVSHNLFIYFYEFFLCDIINLATLFSYLCTKSNS